MNIDVVGVFDSKLVQLFPQGRPISAKINEDAKLMEHPLESGAVVTDHRVISPVEIDLDLVLGGDEYADAYKAVKSAFLGNATLIVQTKTASYRNMVIRSMPHEESADMLDAVPLRLKLKEVLLITAQFQALPPRKAATPKDYSVLDRGEQQPKQSSILFRTLGN